MDQAKIDTLKAVATYITVAIMSLGGLAAIIYYDMDPDKLAIVAGLVGAALQFLTTGETATRTARAISSASNGHGQ